MALSRITEQAEPVLPMPSGRQHQLPRSRRPRHYSCCLAPSPQPISPLCSPPRSASSLSPVLHPNDPAFISPPLSWTLLQLPHQPFFTPAFLPEIPFLIFLVNVSSFRKTQLKCHLLQEASRDFPGRAHCLVLCTFHLPKNSIYLNVLGLLVNLSSHPSWLLLRGPRLWLILCIL